MVNFGLFGPANNTVSVAMPADSRAAAVKKIFFFVRELGRERS